jgi:hypothetical protein
MAAMTSNLSSAGILAERVASYPSGENIGGTLFRVPNRSRACKCLCHGIHEPWCWTCITNHQELDFSHVTDY